MKNIFACLCPDFRVRFNRKSGFTLVEMLVVMLVVSVLYSIIGFGMRDPKKAALTMAATRANLVWHAETKYFAAKGSFSTDWYSLGMTNPNTLDPVFTYAFENMSPNTFKLTVTRKGTSTGLSINNTGTITYF